MLNHVADVFNVYSAPLVWLYWLAIYINCSLNLQSCFQQGMVRHFTMTEYWTYMWTSNVVEAHELFYVITEDLLSPNSQNPYYH